MKKLGKNRDDQKRSNWGLVLRLLATGRCSSRIDLAKATGLTKATITQIVGDMISQGIVEEAEKEVRSEIGRHPTKLVISGRAPKVIGVLIDRAYCAAVLCDLNMNVLSRSEVRKEWSDKEDLMDNVFRLVDDLLETKQCVIAIGVASVGPVNASEGMIVNPFYFHDIHDLPVKRLLEERYSLPVFFDHDNQCAVLAESLYGNGKNYQDMLLVSVARGVGCGIIVQGHRIHSAYGYAPEIGHVSIDHKGEKCSCGNRGCLEMYTNSDTVLKKLRLATGEKLDYAGFMARSEETAIDGVMQECIGNLTIGLISVMNILNTQLILLGGDCCAWPDRYIRQIEEEVNRLKFGNKNIRIPVRKTFFLYDSQLFGAACHAVNAMFNGELSGPVMRETPVGA